MSDNICLKSPWYPYIYTGSSEKYSELKKEFENSCTEEDCEIKNGNNKKQNKNSVSRAD